jgi:hypothetical protein
LQPNLQCELRVPKRASVVQPLAQVLRMLSEMEGDICLVALRVRFISL